MEFSHFCPPADACFNIGSTENKVPVSLGRRNRKAKVHRPFNKTRPLKSIRAARENLQRSVASRSSALRQGKLAQARAGPETSEFDAAQAAAKKAYSSPVITRTIRKTKTGKCRKIIKFPRCIEYDTPNASGNTNTSVIKDDNIFQFTASFSKQGPTNDANPLAG